MTRRYPVPWRRAVAAAATSAAILTSLVLLQAASPVFWRVATQAELLRGEAENVSIDADGRLTLGPRTELLYEAPAPFLWSMARAGGALWIGSGNDGRVLRVTADGEAATLVEAREPMVHALAASS
ncbi:MAG: hypothetical protein F4Y57_12475, partial [Acidobacteria bacterium]|nr:hypothetical protein [Acidobacteriota bacterium]